ncbi:hypothetical protein PoB_005906700 [Plakobranchus ocellatus]|uniref:Uncharacterized protein n=1 Tax=Plakobranchus ocellatus TaxID=259542 RepID=A0AAV4CL75_9GAST|nr:hypothetical protein PoB_005906700 [Plakobranchus ocellatus]
MCTGRSREAGKSRRQAYKDMLAEKTDERYVGRGRRQAEVEDIKTMLAEKTDERYVGRGRETGRSRRHKDYAGREDR